MTKTRPLEDRFWEKVARGDPDECWDWQGSTTQGYGMIRVGKMVGAHRVAWELANGPVPDGLCVLHRCDRPSCVNVRHLFLGSQLENIADRHQKGRSSGAPGEANANAKLTWPEVREIRRRYADGGITQYALADEYGVRQTLISGIVRGERWLE